MVYWYIGILVWYIGPFMDDLSSSEETDGDNDDLDDEHGYSLSDIDEYDWE